MSLDVNAYVGENLDNEAELAAVQTENANLRAKVAQQTAVIVEFEDATEQLETELDGERAHREADHAALQRVHGLIAKFAANARDAETRSQDSERDLIHTYYAGKCEGWEDAKDELESAFNPDSSTPMRDTGGAGT